MRVDLPRSLRPGLSLDIDVGWRFTVPPYGAGRMGHDGDLYELGQWYPRMAVYDDVKGWNHEPYIGAGEFYLEYGSFDVAITVPAAYIVAATGALQNPLQVLTATQRARLLRARTSDSAIAIITKAEAGDPAKTRPLQRGTLTWRFHADSVRDFAFAAAPNFRWDASGWSGIAINTYYRPTAALWSEANRIVREAVLYYSQQWYHYPYPHISSIEGPIEGMEYPMMTFDPAGPTRIDLQWVLAHELGHQWMPMIVGANERCIRGWMRGSTRSSIWPTPPTILWALPTATVSRCTRCTCTPNMRSRARSSRSSTPPVESRDLFWTGYQKPALMMQQLRDQVLGRERFDSAFREYLRTWAFKHPRRQISSVSCGTIPVRTSIGSGANGY